jgi:hypothetical protein
MDQVRIVQEAMRIEHRHGDEWVRLEPSPEHTSAEGDPERRWALGRIFRCPSCAEEVRVVRDDERRR